METFRTTVPVSPSADEISYSTPLLFLGSCFSEHISKRLSQYKFSVITNPFGIVYNPLSISSQLHQIISNHTYSEKDLTSTAHGWVSLNHHGNFSGNHPPELIQGINKKIAQAHAHLKNTQFLFLTFGTSWVYEWAESGKVVSNCHKIPSKKFTYRLASVDEMVSSLRPILEKLKADFPHLNVVASVSPVRHLKNGFFENNLSKGRLFDVIHQLKNEQLLKYFGAYEMVLDDLRDYRFYNEDMLHPSEQAIAYVFTQFRKTFFNAQTTTHFERVTKLIQALHHRPLQPQSSAHQKFIAKTLTQIEEIEAELGISFQSEKLRFTHT